MTVISHAPLGRNETPLDLIYTFIDADADPINLTGATVKIVCTKPGATVTINGYMSDAANGAVGMAWTDDLTDTAGPFSLQFWVDLAGQTLGSAVIVYQVTNLTAPTF